MEGHVGDRQQHAFAVLGQTTITRKRIEHGHRVAGAGDVELYGVDAARHHQIIADHRRMAHLLGRPPAQPHPPRVVEIDVFGDHPVVGGQIVLGEQQTDQCRPRGVGQCRLGGIPVVAAEGGEVEPAVPGHVVVRIPVLGHLHVPLQLGLAHRKELAQQVGAGHRRQTGRDAGETGHEYSCICGCVRRSVKQRPARRAHASPRNLDSTFRATGS